MPRPMATDRRRMFGWALAPLAVAALAGCGGDTGKAEAGKAAEPSSRTLAATVLGRDYDTLGGTLTNAGLIGVLEGKGPYTLFAPADAAFTAAAGGADFTDEAMRAQGAALLRAHIVPGALTRADIVKALDGAGAGGVKMRTMADTLLTFSRDGEAIMLTSADRARARLSGEATLASNGVLHPVDGLLVKPTAPAG